MSDTLIAEGALWIGDPIIAALVFTPRPILPADPQRWSVEFYFTGIVSGPGTIVVWPGATNDTSQMIQLPSGGLSFQWRIHGNIVGREWWAASNPNLNLAVLVQRWRG